MAHRRIEPPRHETRRRILTVETVERLMPRTGFTAADLGDFVSASADHRIKLFFQSGDD